MSSEESNKVRKNVVEELVVVNLAMSDEDVEREVIKHLGPLVGVFVKQYKNVKVVVVDNEIEDDEDSNELTKSGRRVQILGEREETQEEFEDRMGILKEDSWVKVHSGIVR